MQRLLNFNAGPAQLPAEVLEQAAAAVKEYEGQGMSILELPHRSDAFDAILDEAGALVRKLCRLDDEFEILWLQGGGRMQFCMVPMNFLPDNGTAGYIETGHWAADAMEHAHYYGKVQNLASSRNLGFLELPELPAEAPASLSYIHLTTNNTIYGTQCKGLPVYKSPLIADMSSDILSRERDYNRCALFYAVAQKNLGIAGVTLVAVRKSMLGKQARILPPMLSYAGHAKAHSVLNTAPVFAIYCSLLMLRWIDAQGTEQLFSLNQQKARMVYEVLDNSEDFYCPVRKADRSDMNIVFKARSEAAAKALEELALQEGITGIQGHRSVGGFRASLYNAMTLAEAETLAGAIVNAEKNIIAAR